MEFFALNNTTHSKLSKCYTLLAEAGLPAAPELEPRRRAYFDLIREWNRAVSLVSARDLDEDRLVARHWIDALSLAPRIAAEGHAAPRLLDIGSGGGFPAIPLLLALPHLRAFLAERSERKVGFLRKCLAALQLSNAEILVGEYPSAAPATPTEWVTARAVERPERLLRSLGAHMGTESRFLCQFPEALPIDPKMFHVEPVDDAWSQAGLRRGTLRIVRRAAQDAEHANY